MCIHSKPFLLNFSFRNIPHKKGITSIEKVPTNTEALVLRKTVKNWKTFVFLKIFGKVLEGKPQKNIYFLNGSKLRGGKALMARHNFFWRLPSTRQ